MSNQLPVLNQDYLMSEILISQVKQAIPRGMDLDRFRRILYSTVKSTPKLFQCTQHSFYNSLMQSAMLGLEPNTPQGLAYLIPYGTKCTFQIGYKGLIHIARRSGKVQHITSQLVFKSDVFHVNLGTDYNVTHTPSFAENPETREDYLRDVSHVYAVIKFKDGSFEFAVMSIQEVEKIRKKCAANGSEAWLNWFGEQAKKTVIKRLLKTVTLDLDDGVALANAIEVDGKNEAGKTIDITKYIELEEENRVLYLKNQQLIEDLAVNKDRTGINLDDIKQNKKTESSQAEKKEPTPEEIFNGLPESQKEPVNLNLESETSSSGSKGFDQYKEDLTEIKTDLTQQYLALSAHEKHKVIRQLYPEDSQRRKVVIGALKKDKLNQLQDILINLKDNQDNDF